MSSKTLWTSILATGLAVGSLATLSIAEPPAGEKPAQKQTAPAAKPETKPEAKPEKKREPSISADASGAKVGEAAPDFTLTDLSGKTVKLSDYKGKVVVLEWFNPGCPYVKKHHEKNTTFQDLAKDFIPKGVQFLAINSGAAGKEGAGREVNIEAAKKWKIGYPILLDEKGETGRKYGAKTTPHMFVINAEGKLVYAGAIDNNTDATKAGDVNYVRKALEEVLAGKPVTTAETKSYGCSVKYGG